MATKTDRFADLRVKHLEMLQKVISRLASQSVAAKNGCATITIAVIGFGITLQKPLVLWLALLPIAIFALLETQYLRLERHFRDEYERVRAESWVKRPDFRISREGMTQSYFGAMLSWSIAAFYLPLALAVCAAIYLARQLYDQCA